MGEPEISDEAVEAAARELQLQDYKTRDAWTEQHAAERWDGGLAKHYGWLRDRYRARAREVLAVAAAAARTRGNAEKNDIDATGSCTCAGCIGMGPCDLDPPEERDECWKDPDCVLGESHFGPCMDQDEQGASDDGM